MIDISDKIIKQTTKCNKDFKCLDESSCPNCKIERIINDKIYFVEEHKSYCPYSFRVGENTICLCPVRKELYNKYKV